MVHITSRVIGAQCVMTKLLIYCPRYEYNRTHNEVIQASLLFKRWETINIWYEDSPAVSFGVKTSKTFNEIKF